MYLWLCSIHLESDSAIGEYCWRRRSEGRNKQTLRFAPVWQTFNLFKKKKRDRKRIGCCSCSYILNSKWAPQEIREHPHPNPPISLQVCVTPSGVMGVPRMTDKSPDIHPPLKCPDALTELSCCRVLGATEIEWRGLVRLCWALWRRYIGSWWLFLTAFMGELVYLLYMWQQIFNSIFLLTKSHNGWRSHWWERESN